jgi:hypothetical protein
VGIRLLVRTLEASQVIACQPYHMASTFTLRRST